MTYSCDKSLIPCAATRGWGVGGAGRGKGEGEGAGASPHPPKSLLTIVVGGKRLKEKR